MILVAAVVGAAPPLRHALPQRMPPHCSFASRCRVPRRSRPGSSLRRLRPTSPRPSCTRRTARSCGSATRRRASRPRPVRRRARSRSLGRLPFRCSEARSRAESVNVRATAAAGVAGASASGSGSTVGGLTVLGQPVTAAAGVTVQLADWGTLEVLATTEKLEADPVRGAEAAVTGLRVTLGIDHGGLPAGTVISVGSVSARADAGEVGQTPGATTTPKPPPKPVPPKPPQATGRRPAGAGDVRRRQATRARPGRARGDRATHRRRLRVPRLRPGVVRRLLRRPAPDRQRRLASRRGHPRPARHTHPRRHGRHRLRRRVERARRLEGVAARRVRKRVLLRASVRLLAACRGRQARDRGRRARLHGGHG